MLNKKDCFDILINLENDGKDINWAIKKLALSTEIPTDVLQFIVKNKGIEVVNFYEMLRKKHNEHKSILYINLLNNSEKQDISITISCLLMQIALYSNKLDNTYDKALFLREVRAEELTRALNEYYKTENIDLCYKALQAIKIDLMVLECLAGKRASDLM